MDAEKIYLRYGAAMLRHAQFMLGSNDCAEDAVQEALIRMMRLSPDFKDEVHEKAWVLTVTGNICRDVMRRQRRQCMSAILDGQIMTGAFMGPEEEAGRRETDKELVRAVMELPQRYREAVLLVYYHDLTGAQAADALGITRTAFRSRLMRARIMLRKALGEEVEM